MSQEIIATSPRGTLARPDDAWATGATTALAGYNPNPPRPSPIKIIHRLLRGRVLLAVILGTAGLIAGAIYGWTSTVPKYEANGLIEVAPYFITRNASERTQAYFLQFV